MKFFNANTYVCMHKCVSSYSAQVDDDVPNKI